MKIVDFLHLGLVYKDIEKQAEIMKSYSNKFKISFISKEPVELQTIYKGQNSKVSMRIALC